MSVALIVDIAAACVVAFFVVRGLIHGFSGEIVGLVGLFASLFCCWTFSQPAAGLVLKHFPKLDSTVITLACAVAIFLVVSVAFVFIGEVLSFIVQAAKLSMTDHILGMFIGAVKAFLLILFVYGVLVTFSPVLPTDWMAESYTMQGAKAVWPPVRDFLEEHELLDFNALTNSYRATQREAAD